MHPTTFNITQKTQPRKYPDFSGYGWIIIICGFLLYLIVDGIAYNLGLINSAWLAEFQQSETATSWIGSIFYSVPLLSAPITAQLVEKFGCKMITIICGIIATFGFVMSSFCGSIEQLYVSVGLIGGFGVSAAYVVGILEAERWFEKHRTLAIGIVSSGTGFGTFVIAPTTQRLLEAIGWRNTMYFLASLTVMMSIVGCFVRDPPWMTGEFGEDEERDGTENFGYCGELEVNYGTWKEKNSIDWINSKRNGRNVEKSSDAHEDCCPKIDSTANYQKTDDFNSRNNANDIEDDNEQIKRVNMSKSDVEYASTVNGEHNDVQIEIRQQMTETQSANNTDESQLIPKTYINSPLMSKSDQNHLTEPKKYQESQNLSQTIQESHIVSLNSPQSQISPPKTPESKKPSQEPQKSPNSAENSHKIISSPNHFEQLTTIPITIQSNPDSFPIIFRFIKNQLKIVKKIFSHFSNRNFTLLAISTFAIYALYNVPMFFIVELLKNYGYTEAQCANYLSVIGFSLLVGMVTLGYIGDISGDQVKNVNALCVLICGIAECLLPTCAENSITFGICCAIFGFSFASAYVLIPKITEMVVGVGEFATAIGLNFFVQGLALLFGIPFASTIYESIGSWKTSFEICGAIIASGSIFAFMTKVRRD